MKTLEILDKILKALSDVDGEVLTALDEEIKNEEIKVAIMSNILNVANTLAGTIRAISDEMSKEIKVEGDEDELEVVANLATKFDQLGMLKEASVLDELLLTIGADKKALAQYSYDEEDKINKLREKYRSERREDLYTKGQEKMEKNIGAQEMEKEVKNKVKNFRPLEASLSTRYSPDMPGVQLIRVGDGVYQCPITNKLYDFKAGYTTAKGNKVPGSSIGGQMENFGYSATQDSVGFGTRQDTLDGNKY